MADQATIASTSGPSESTSFGSDWPAQAADTIARVVEQARAKTTDKAILVARAVVYGLLAALLGSAALVLGAIIAVRLLDAYLPDAVVGERHTWAAHLVTGFLFTLVGALLWSRRHARSG